MKYIPNVDPDPAVEFKTHNEQVCLAYSDMTANDTNLMISLIIYSQCIAYSSI